MSFQPYTKWKHRQLTGGATSVDFDNDTLKAILLKSTYSPNITATGHEFLSDVSSHQVLTGSAYTGPITLAGVSVVAAGTTATMYANNIVIAKDVASGFANARYMVLYKHTGNDNTSPLIFLADFVEDQRNTTGTFDIKFDPTGLFYT